MIVVRHGQSEFNAAFAVTRRDPGIVDPDLTELGRAQAQEAAERLAGLIRPARLVSSPYARAIATARPIAARFGLTIEVDPLIGEWAAFSCDIGTPASELARRHPDLALDHLPETWWPSGEEEHHVTARADRFRATTWTRDDWDCTVIVSHWGFLRALTGVALPNGGAARLERGAEATGGVQVVHPAET